MPYRIPAWLEDIQTCINYIELFIGSQRNFSEFCQNIMMKQAIERNLEIIGEATIVFCKRIPISTLHTPKVLWHCEI